MQIERSRRNNDDRHRSSYDSLERGIRRRENDSTMSSNFLGFPSLSSSSGMNYIEHRVSKMDTLAGVAIKYGVEVADIKRMNCLVTDLQMFAHKSLQIPLPGRHPPSPIVSNGSSGPGESSKLAISRQSHIDLLESFESLRLKSSQQRVSAAMSSLQDFYGLTPKKNKGLTEGTEMTNYKTGGALYLEDAEICPTRHHRTRSLVNGFLPENSNLEEDVLLSEAHSEHERSNEKSSQRHKKSTPELLLKEDSGSKFSRITWKGLALRPKSASRTALAVETESGRLNPIPMADSIVDSFTFVRKSSSTSNLQESDSNCSVWTTSKWTSKLDLQAHGLPKPITGRRNKAALD
ncbi:uncharacterized protein LOC143855218 [Tasmannia lanceolata]|uniref:uncharacterized protein LOC143855218 n=1 Tax=Tasmannia lanceolata TaxID=3420 RepID=UPI0040649361